MDLRSDTLVYPFDTIPLDPGPFLGENPPTNKEVLLKLKGYEKQTGSKYKKDMRYALMKVSNDIKEWWLNTGFKLKTNNGIIYKVQLLKKKHTSLFCNRNKPYAKYAKIKFLNIMREIFNPVCKKYTNRLSISNNPSDSRKYKLLKSMIENKQENKIVCQKKRNGEKKDRLISRKENANSIDQIIVLSEESEAVETEDDVEDEDYIYEGTKPPKKKILSKGLCIVADKYQSSNREIF